LDCGIDRENNRAFDIVATRDKWFASIRVKTKSSKSFQWSAKPDGTIFLDIKRKRDFCILVDMPTRLEEAPTYYIVSTAVLDKWLRDDFQMWVNTLGTRGQAHATENRRRIICVDDDLERIGHGNRLRLEPYRGVWQSLE